MEFFQSQEELSERCSNCFCEIVPSKSEIPPIKVEGDEMRSQSTEVEDNFMWSTDNSEFNVFEAVAFIHRWTNEDFNHSLLTLLKLEYSQTNVFEPFPFLLSVCATCKPILLQLFRLHQEFNQLSSKHSIISRIRELHQNKYESPHVKAEPFDNSYADGCGPDSFLSDAQDFSDTNLSNRNDSPVEFHTPDEIPTRRERTRAQTSKVARPVKKREVTVIKNKADTHTACNDVSVSIPRLDESLVKAYGGRSPNRTVRLRIKKEMPDEESKSSFIVVNQMKHKKRRGSKNKSVESYKCDRCDRKFRTKQLIDHHMRAHRRQDLRAIPKFDPGPGPFQCSHCPMQISNYENFRSHVKAHEISVICDVCGKRYCNKRKLLVHKRFLHPEEGSAPQKPSCPICGKCVRMLNAHMKLHDKDRERFACGQCEKSFQSKRSWQDHVECAHSGQRFICATCGKEFQTKLLLIAHEKIHSEEKRYPCETCHKTFRNRSKLEIHYGTHSDARPYLCQLCGKSYKRRNHLKTHMEGHKSQDLGTAIFSCNQCGQTFKNGSTRWGHIKRIHADKSKQIHVVS